MGAERFEDIGTGETAEEAFRLLVDASAWENGHGGYTGTIAEKDGFVLFDPASVGLAVGDFLRLVEEYDHDHSRRGVEEIATPEELALIRSAHETADDKFADAACVELPASDLRARKLLENSVPERKAFLFWGWASQ